MDLAEPNKPIEMPKGNTPAPTPVPAGKPAFPPAMGQKPAAKAAPEPSKDKGAASPPKKQGKQDLWGPLAKAAKDAGGEVGPEEEEQSDQPEGEEALDGQDQAQDEAEGEEESSAEEGEVSDEEARTAKAITLKTPDGKKIVVPKNALFPYKNNGKIEWIPFNLAARQLDGMTNYSTKLNELNQHKSRIDNEVSVYKRRNEMWESENSKRVQLKETMQGIFQNGRPEDKIRAMDHFLANQVGVSPELYMYEMLDYLTPHAEAWSGYSEDKKNYLKAQAQINWDKHQRSVAAEREARQQGESDISRSTEQAQQAITQICNTYGIPAEEWEHRFKEVADAKERGEIRDFDINTVLYTTMYHRINDEVVKNAAREINPIFKDPAKAQELANELFELFKANPLKPRQWFIDIAREAFGADAAVKRVNEAHRRANGGSQGGNGRMVKSKKTDLPPYQRWGA